MSGIETHSQNVPADVNQLANQILSVLPELDPDSRRTAVQLYRLLGEGNLVSRNALAKAAGVSLERVNEILEGWTGIYYEGEKIVGFWGLTPKPFSKHLLKYDGRTEFAWCAWDTLFLPEILGKSIEIESNDPETDQIIRLTVTPDGVLKVSPDGAVMSIMEPTDDMTEDVVAKFCHFVYFFPSVEVGQQWVEKHPGTSLMSIDDAYRLGKLRNRGQLKEALDIPVK